MERLLTFLVIIIIFLIAAAAAYWYYLFYVPSPQVTVTTTGSEPVKGFMPLGGNPNTVTPDPIATNIPTSGEVNPNATPAVTEAPIQALRQLSSSPVGGFGVVRTATTSIVRWVDRGRGNIYEATNKNPFITTLSNTLVPRIYLSIWNKDLTAFVGQYISDTSDAVTTVLANIVRNTTANAATSGATSTTSVSETPFQLKGKLISGTVVASAVNPTQDLVLFVTKDKDRAIGYTAKFDGSGQKQVFNIPMTQISVEWPEANTIAITTKASAYYSGFLYILNLKTGEMKGVLANMPGLKAKVSRDGTKVFYSRTGIDGNKRIVNSILDLKTGQTKDVIFQTLADKCVWSNKNKQAIYCGVASQLYDGVYPDDWYSGKMAFTDNIWILDANTNQARQVNNLLTQGNALVDVMNPQIDPNDEYLFFMNKNNLSLWSLDLASTN